MIRKGIYCILALLALCSFKGMAQAVKTNIVPEGYQKAQLYEGDTMAVVNLREVFIYPQVKFKNKREQAKYNKLVRDVKRTLPYAKMVYDTVQRYFQFTVLVYYFAEFVRTFIAFAALPESQCPERIERGLTSQLAHSGYYTVRIATVNEIIISAIAYFRVE